LHSELEEQIEGIKQNEPYILKINHNQFYVVAEKVVVSDTIRLMDALINMICAYFVFDIEYPKSMYATLIFVQRYILGIADKQRIPDVVTRVLTSLDQHKQ